MDERRKEGPLIIFIKFLSEIPLFQGKLDRQLVFAIGFSRWTENINRGTKE